MGKMAAMAAWLINRRLWSGGKNRIGKFGISTCKKVYCVGAMVVLSLDMYSKLTDGVEAALDEADRMAEEDSRRMSHEEVFENQKKII